MEPLAPPDRTGSSGASTADTQRLGPARLTDEISIVASGELGLSDPLDCHVYLIAGPAGLVVVDAGAGRDVGTLTRRVRDEASRTDLAPAAVLLTHAHADHAGGLAELAAELQVPAYASAVEAELVASGNREALGLDAAIRNRTYPDDFEYRTTDDVRTVDDGAKLALGGLTFTALVSPGHSAGSVVWVVETVPGHTAMFAGDTVFAGGEVSLLNLDGSDAAGYRRSLPRLAALDVDGLFPGHGLPVLSGGGAHVEVARRWSTTSVLPNRARPRTVTPPEADR